MVDPSGEIPLLEVVKAIDGEDVLDRCMFDIKQCGEAGTCPLHEDWLPIRNQIKSLLASKTIADLSEEGV